MAELPGVHNEERPIKLEGVPDEEDVSRADAADRLDEDPDEQLNRPEQPDVTERELAQFDVPEDH
jgi:hypothetical protein